MNDKENVVVPMFDVSQFLVSETLKDELPTMIERAIEKQHLPIMSVVSFEVREELIGVLKGIAKDEHTLEVEMITSQDDGLALFDGTRNVKNISLYIDDKKIKSFDKFSLHKISVMDFNDDNCVVILKLTSKS